MIYVSIMIIKLIIIFLLILTIIVCNVKEKFISWTPQVIDPYNQPYYRNYFYYNNYMYPL